MTTVREDEQFIYVTPLTPWELLKLHDEKWWTGA